jgi:hypothetical protein
MVDDEHARAGGSADIPGLTRSCPSAPCSEGALLLGVMTSSGRIAYLQPPTAVDADFVDQARSRGRPESRFRFSQPCIECECPQWTGSRCGIIDTLLSEDAMPADEKLPACRIRPTCRWFAQRGPDACTVCPYVVADVGGVETYSSMTSEDHAQS